MVIKANRRKTSYIGIALNVAYIVTLMSLTFWLSAVNAKIQNVTTLQENVLQSNAKFGHECKDIKQELNGISEQLEHIYPLLIAKTKR